MTDDDRTSYVGGPGSAAVLGVHPWQTGVDLWLQLTKRAAPTEVNAAMKSGMRLERAVLDFAGEELKTEILPGPFVRDMQLPIAAGHLDGIAAATGDVVEAKTSRSHDGWGEPGTGDVPAHIAAQAEWYLGLVPEARICWVPVLFSGLEFAMYRVERDDQLIEQMRNLVWRWWQDYITTDTPPPPATGRDASLLFPRDAGRVVIADDATTDAIVQLRAIRHTLDLAERERDELESRIKLAMGDAAAITVNGAPAATWKTTRAMRFDSAQFKADQPELYQQFSREHSSRRFLLKG